MKWQFEDFYKNPSASDGYRSTCKTCEKMKRLMKSRPKGEALGLHDTPYGLEPCPRCKKLIPLTEKGDLEPHYTMVDHNTNGVYPSVRMSICGDG
jgi:hypothetical protein